MTLRKGGPFGRKLSLKRCPRSTKTQNHRPATPESANLHDPGAASMSPPNQYATCVSQRRLARFGSIHFGGINSSEAEHSRTRPVAFSPLPA